MQTEAKEEVFSWVFKQTIRDLDTLLDLNPGNTQLKYARAALLQAKWEPIHAPIEPPKGANTPEVPDFEYINRIIEKRTGIKSMETQTTLDAEIKAAGAALDAAIKTIETKEAETRRDTECARSVPGPSLDFTGTWLMDNGKQVTITEYNETHNEWKGFVKDEHVSRFWDAEGKHRFDPTHNLKTRIREGAGYK